MTLTVVVVRPFPFFKSDHSHWIVWMARLSGPPDVFLTFTITSVDPACHVDCHISSTHYLVKPVCARCVIHSTRNQTIDPAYISRSIWRQTNGHMNTTSLPASSPPSAPSKSFQNCHQPWRRQRPPSHPAIHFTVSSTPSLIHSADSTCFLA
jgi:hypothetical protein